jgi:putative FmdB family regulatory protein
MPLYDFHCADCDTTFEQWVRGFDTSGVVCPSCKSARIRKLLSMPAVIRSGKDKGPRNDRLVKDEEVRYFEKKRDYLKAAKAAEKAGQQDWQVKDLYQKAGKNPYGI